MSSLTDSAPSAAASKVPALSDREAAVYDRQLRVWGMQGQIRMKKSRVLLLGANGLNAEVCKNLTLAGVNVTVQDTEEVAAADVGCQFFVSAEHVGKNRAQASVSRVRELNPFADVRVSVKPRSELLSESSSYLKDEGITVVVCADPRCSFEEHGRLGAAARAAGAAYFAAAAHGMHGIFVSDLGDKHTFRKSLGQGKTSDEISVSYPSVAGALGAPWSELTKQRRGVEPLFYALSALDRAMHGAASDGNARPTKRQRVEGDTSSSSSSSSSSTSASALTPSEDELRAALAALCTDHGVDEASTNLGAGAKGEALIPALASSACAELSPTCTVLGGFIGQEVLKFICLRDAPFRNIFLLDGRSCKATVHAVPHAHPQPKQKKPQGKGKGSGSCAVLSADADEDASSDNLGRRIVRAKRPGDKGGAGASSGAISIIDDDDDGNDNDGGGGDEAAQEGEEVMAVDLT